MTKTIKTFQNIKFVPEIQTLNTVSVIFPET